jgi:CheY-like chemotaxis protein
MGYTEILRRELAGSVPTRLEKYLDNIFSAGERARDLVKQILTFSRQSEVELRPVLLRQVLEEALRLMRATMPTTIAIDRKFESQAMVMADRSQLHQIIMNLCTNACQAMSKGGKLTVTLTDVVSDRDLSDRFGRLPPGGYVRLEVADTGEGIPAELLERIFDPFFTTKPQGQGTGLGLSTVHGAVKSMRGLITVNSEVGTGSRFEIYLPQLHREKVHPCQLQTAAPTGNEHILYLDDDATLTEIGGEMLRGLGYQVTAFSSSIDALQYMLRPHTEIDLLVSDMTMPQLTGLDLAERLRAQGVRLPIIICTGNANDISQHQMTALNIAHCVQKPITLSQLAVKVRETLDAESYG